MLLMAIMATGSSCAPPNGETALVIDQETVYQVIESFGASGAWWAQYVGGWDEAYGDSGRSVRGEIAALLFDREHGIGLTAYRCNMGAGSKDSGKGDFPDPHRRAQSFRAAQGGYDWEKDAQAVWMMRETAEYGAEEIVLFFNSPPEWLTKNGMAHLSKGGDRSNIAPENYAAFARYACDVAERFVQEGLPVRFLSPVNEPQWDWTGGQEGCHYEPEETAGVFAAFAEELRSRPLLRDVRLSGPESGEWGGRTPEYVSALLEDAAVSASLDGIDCHSYWSDTKSKAAFRGWMDGRYPSVKVRMSEWCEMVSGSDFSMDSAIHLAQTLAEDLRVLNAVSWQCWVAVAPGGYRDGLIYVREADQSFTPLKRLWAFGNYSRFVRPGFSRVSVTGGEAFSAAAFTGAENGSGKLVVVLVNEKDEEKRIRLEGQFEGYGSVSVYETSPKNDLARVSEGIRNTLFTLSPLSVTTVVYSE